MKSLLHALVSITIFTNAFFSPTFGSIAHASPESARMKPQDQALLKIAVKTINSFKNMNDLVGKIQKKSDRDYLLSQLGKHGNVKIKAKFVEPNNIFIEMAGRKTTIALKDMSSFRFMVLKKEFKFNPKQSAEEAVKTLSRFLAVNSNVSYIIPEANAIAPLVLLAIGAYVSIGFTSTVWCSSNKVNSVGECSLWGALWPIPAGVIGAGMIEQAFEKSRLSKSHTSFDVTEITCPKDGKPLKAIIVDADKNFVSLEVNFRSNGNPEKIEYRAENNDSETFLVKENWDPDTSDREFYDGQWTWDMEMAAKGAKQISEACKASDSASALANYLKNRQGAITVAPRIKDGEVQIKSVE